ncbi:MAG: hypothetical protein ACOCYV_00340 [Planctomycetota bacterium]
MLMRSLGVTTLILALIGCGGSSDDGGSSGSSLIPPSSTTFGDVVIAAAAGSHSGLQTYQWLDFAPADGETRVFKGFAADGTTETIAASRAWSYGYHQEPGFGGETLLFSQLYTVTEGVGDPVWVPTGPVLGHALATNGGLYNVGSGQDATWTTFTDPMAIIPGPMALDATFETIELGVPPEETYHYKLVATDVSITVPYAGGTTYSDCLKIHNQSDSQYEYYSPSFGGLVAIESPYGGSGWLKLWHVSTAIDWDTEITLAKPTVPEADG